MSLNDGRRDIKKFACKLYQDSFLYSSRDAIPFLVASVLYRQYSDTCIKPDTLRECS